MERIGASKIDGPTEIETPLEPQVEISYIDSFREDQPSILPLEELKEEKPHQNHIHAQPEPSEKEEKVSAYEKSLLKIIED